jgi:hypothetical protein
MSLRVIGAGVGRTGTMSLKVALERLLGAPCYHMVEVFEHPAHFPRWTAAARGEPVDWHALLAGYAAAVDWPAAAFWEELAAAFPDAIILWSHREPEAWWKSVSQTIFRPDREPPFPAMREMMDTMMRARFTPTPRDREPALAAYERHNAHVRAAAPKDRLVEWRPGDGWAPLCAALKLPVPDEPFPHVNTTDEFNARIAARAAGLHRP